MMNWTLAFAEFPAHQRVFPHSSHRDAQMNFFADSDEKTITCSRHSGLALLVVSCLSGSAFAFVWCHWIMCVLLPDAYARANYPILVHDCPQRPYIWFEGVALLLFAAAVTISLSLVSIMFIARKTLRVL